MAAECFLDHVLIVVKDLERSIDFYELLGFEHLETIQRPRDRVALMRLGGVNVELMSLPEGEETYRLPRKLSDIGFRHVGFRVENLEGGLREAQGQDPVRLTAQGHRGKGEPYDGLLQGSRRRRDAFRPGMTGR